MDNTLDALRNLYAALGGESGDVENLQTIPDIINAISTQVSTVVGTKELPEVDADDNGKVLKVVDGEWAVGTDATE